MSGEKERVADLRGEPFPTEAPAALSGSEANHA
jgi:hypothetical protein